MILATATTKLALQFPGSGAKSYELEYLSSQSSVLGDTANLDVSVGNLEDAGFYQFLYSDVNTTNVTHFVSDIPVLLTIFGAIYSEGVNNSVAIGDGITLAGSGGNFQSANVNVTQLDAGTGSSFGLNTISSESLVFASGGLQNTYLLASGTAQVDLFGAGQVLANANSATVSVFGNASSITGTSSTIGFLLPGLSETVSGFKDAVSLAAFDSLTLGAGSLGGTVYGTGDNIALTNGGTLTNNTGAIASYVPSVSATLSASSTETVNGSVGSAVSLAYGDTLYGSRNLDLLSSSFDTLIGSANTAIVSGSGTLVASNSTVDNNFGSTLYTGLTETLLGLNDKVALAAFDNLTLSAGSLGGIVYGTGDSVTLGNTGTLTNNTGAISSYVPSVSATLSANSTGTVNGSVGSAVSLAYGDTLYGSNNLDLLSSSFDTLIGSANTAIVSGSGTLVASNSTVDNNFGSTLYTGLTETLLGLNDKVALAAFDNLTLSAGSLGGTIYGTGDSVTLGNAGTLTNNTGAISGYFPSVSATLMANSTDTVNGSVGSAVNLASGDTLYGSNNIDFFSGGSGTLIGSANQAIVSGSGTLAASNDIVETNLGTLSFNGESFNVNGTNDSISLSAGDQVLVSGVNNAIGFHGNATGARAVVNDSTAGTSAVFTYVGGAGEIGVLSNETIYSGLGGTGSVTGTGVSLNDGTRQTVYENSSGNATFVTTNYADGSYSTVSFGTTGTGFSIKPASTTDNYSATGQLVESTYAYMQQSGILYSPEHQVTFYDDSNTHLWSSVQYIYGDPNSPTQPNSSLWTTTIHNHDGTTFSVAPQGFDNLYYLITFKGTQETAKIINGEAYLTGGNIASAGDASVVSADFAAMGFLGGSSGVAGFNASALAVTDAGFAPDYANSFLEFQNATAIREIENLDQIQSSRQNWNVTNVGITVNTNGNATVTFSDDPNDNPLGSIPLTIDPYNFTSGSTGAIGDVSQHSSATNTQGGLPLGHWGY